jgi:hypothetical protein
MIKEAMPGWFTLLEKNGRKTDYYGSRGHYYVLDEHTFSSFLPIPAWCRTCEEMREVEEISPLSELEKQLDELDVSEYWKGKTTLPAVKAAKSRRVEWRKRRTLPASCLTCGKRDIFTFPVGEWVAHPSSGELVCLSSTGMCSTAYAMDFFDVEGHRLIISEEQRQLFASEAKNQI